MTTLLGALVVGAGGLLMGSGAWPFKLMRQFRFEHWWFVGMLVGLVLMPWAIVLAGCPHPLQSLARVPLEAILLGNFFAVGWGIANVLCGICYVRIGVAMTGAILAGLGVSVGAIVPMVFKGSGLFQDAADLGSPAGRTVLAAVGLMLVGVAFASVAGFGRDRQLQKLDRGSGSFLSGLLMTVAAGVLSSFMAFAFVYSQDPIVAELAAVGPGSPVQWKSEKAVEPQKLEVDGQGRLSVPGVGSIAVGGLSIREARSRVETEIEAATGHAAKVQIEPGIAATFGVFAVGLIGGAVVNLAYAAWLLTKNRSWNVLGQNGRELALAVLIGVDFSLAVALMGKGMLLLGALGASVGWGIQQAMQMTGTQLVGFISGEWRGVQGKPRRQMYVALAILILAAVLMAFGNTLAKG